MMNSTEPPLGILELDRLNERIETAEREIRRLRAWREHISAGDLLRSTAIAGTVPAGSGGTGVAGSIIGSVTIWQNNSGAPQVQGTVVVQAGDRLFNVTATQSDLDVIGILDDASVANGANGRVRHSGYQSVVKVQGAVAVGDYLRASTTSGRAESAGASAVIGAFALALTTFAGPGAGTVAAYVFPVDNMGGSSSIVVRKNTGADVGTRPRLNFVEGANITITITDDAGDNEIDITIAGGAASGMDEIFVIAMAIGLG